MTKTTPSKPSRIYASEGVRATSHPTRQLILDSLQQSDRSTVELEQLTGENRYNLYHHLATLEQAGLVGYRLKEGRLKEFYLRRETKPTRSFYTIQRDRIGTREFNRLLRALGPALEGDLPHPSKVNRLDIMLSYEET